MLTISQEEFTNLERKEKHDSYLLSLLNTNKASLKKIWMKKVVKVQKRKKLNPNMSYSKVDWKNVAVAKRRA